MPKMIKTRQGWLWLTNMSALRWVAVLKLICVHAAKNHSVRYSHTCDGESVAMNEITANNTGFAF